MSDLPDIYVFGQNKFGQFREPITENGIQKLDWSQFGGDTLGTNIINFDFKSTVNYSAISIDFKVIISTIDLTKNVTVKNTSQSILKTFAFDDLVAKISCNSNFCLVLLENGDLFRITIATFENQKLNFLNIEESPPKKSIFVMTKAEQRELITDIACGESFCVAVTNFNSVYNIPNKTYKFPRHTNIKKICSGVEHAILVTANGDCFTWGVGLRGQLGHGAIANEDEPKLVDKLSGIKIVDIAAGNWHSAAISIFGDLYVWGWNSHGQLGLKVYATDTIIKSPCLRRKHQTVYTLPLLVDFGGTEELYITKVFCGSKHTLVLTNSGQIFLTGSNNYNQLGLAENVNVKFHKGRIKREIFIDEFKELSLDIDLANFSCYASYACTAFIEKK